MSKRKQQMLKLARDYLKGQLRSVTLFDTTKTSITVVYIKRKRAPIVFTMPRAAFTELAHKYLNEEPTQ